VTNSPAKTKLKTSIRQVFKEFKYITKKYITGHAYGLRLSPNEQQQQNLNANRGQRAVSERSAWTAFQTISPICPYTLILSASFTTWALNFFLKNFLSASKAFDRLLIFVNILRNEYHVFEIRRS